jgi:hypothetical protein
MVVGSQRARRGIAILAGVTAMAAGAALNVTHLVDGGQPLVSPMTGAVLALALGAVAAAFVAGEAWRSGRTTLASCLEVYRKRHGRDPSFSDVRHSLGLPRSTASVYLRKALA